jgi:hypothetical protein
MARALLSNWITRPWATGKRFWQQGLGGGGSPCRGRRAFRPAVEALERRLTPSVTFADQQTFAVGSQVFAVVVGDFNGDGRPDLAVTNFPNGTVTVLLNTTAAGASAPAFAAQQTFAVGSGPNAVAVGDFNGDGRPDLAVTNSNDKTVSVLLNTTPAGSSATSFAAQVTFALGNTPASVAVGDFNGDGRPDLAIANFPQATVLVLLNTTPAGASAPTFAAQQPFAVGSGPDAVAVGDFNGDGRPDLAVANANGGTMSVLLNTTPAGASAPAFAAQQTFAVGGGPDAVAVGDFNGDGRPDLAVANFGGTISVLLNTTAAGSSATSFAAQQTFAAGSGAQFVAVGDFNGDGRPDLAVANFNDKTASVLLNTTPIGASTPLFAAQQTFACGKFPRSVAVGDFNGDGRPDLAVANQNGPTVSVLLNTSAPFASTAPVEVAQFGSTGVWEFNRAFATWVQLTPANATLLAADPLGDVAADFPGYGVQLYSPAAGWKQINGVDATLLAMDALGDVVAEFPGYGVGEYQPASGWRSLTPANASLLAVDALGDVAAVFPGYGVQLFRPSAGWKQINGVDASLLAMDAQGDVVANFQGVGVGEYLPATGWKLLNGTQATALAVNALGVVVANFAGIGVGEYLPSFGWKVFLPTNTALLAIDFNGDVFGEFAGFGVWEFDPFQFGKQLRASDAALLAVA